jgi:hypothetical protein
MVLGSCVSAIVWDRYARKGIAERLCSVIAEMIGRSDGFRGLPSGRKSFRQMELRRAGEFSVG